MKFDIPPKSFPLSATFSLQVSTQDYWQYIVSSVAIEGTEAVKEILSWEGCWGTAGWWVKNVIDALLCQQISCLVSTGKWQMLKLLKKSHPSFGRVCGHLARKKGRGLMSISSYLTPSNYFSVASDKFEFLSYQNFETYFIQKAMLCPTDLFFLFFT